MRPSVVSPRLPFRFPSLCLSFAICSIITVIVDYSNQRDFVGFGSSAVALPAIHHVYVFIFSIEHPTTHLERNAHITWLLTVGSCKFYVRILLLPLLLTLASIFNSLSVPITDWTSTTGGRVGILFILQALILLLLIATANYPEEEGNIHLESGETNDEPYGSSKHWLKKLCGSRFTINPAMPIKRPVVVLCLLTSAVLFFISIADVQSSYGLNTTSSSLAFLLVFFIVAAYTDRQLEHEHDSHPYLYKHLPPASDFMRGDMRYLYLIISTSLAVSFTAGGVAAIPDHIVEGILACISALIVACGLVWPLSRDHVELWSGRVTIPEIQGGEPNV